MNRFAPRFATLCACFAFALAPQMALADDCASAGSYKAAAHHAAQPDIVEVAIAAGSFDTLVAAIQAAGLVDTLKGDESYTVFAPTDEAFAKIPREQLDALLADREQLVAVLTYHVVPGRIEAKDVMGLRSAKTVQGQPVTIAVNEGVTVDGATVIETDIEARNGVIHVIDTVIFPKS